MSGFLHPEDLPMFIIQNTFYPPGKPKWILINILFAGDMGLGKYMQLESTALENTSPQVIYIFNKGEGAIHSDLC